VSRFSAADRQPLIYLITKGETTARNFPEKSAETLAIIEKAVEAGISLIQIREKHLTPRLVFELTAKAAEITCDSPTKLLVNDRADIAWTAGADGVHLTADSLSAAVVRQSSPPDFIVGVSTHTLSEAETAKRHGADFVTFSPIFSSPGKGAPKGLQELSEICAQLKPFPIIALGGIDETNYQTVLDAGAGGFAAIRFLNKAENLDYFVKNSALKK
jgi:thiamine-phosphate pyrophosphorylase